MIKKTIYRICYLLIIVTVASCTKGFKELSVSPNSSEFALPQNLLAPAITGMVSSNMGRNLKINNELMQVTLEMGDTDGKIHRYDIRKSVADGIWNSSYRQLANFKDLYTSGRDNVKPTYMGIALICQAWIFSILTDTYGDVPYSDALKAKEGIFMPKFDRQQDIYLDIFNKLEDANELLKSASNLNADELISDPVYQGTASSWRRFGNSLYLRLLLRASAKMETAVADKIKDMVEVNAANYPLISSNTQSAVLKWTGAVPYQSPFQNWKDGDWNNIKIAEFFVNNLKIWGDPRLPKWATLVRGEYAGIPSGYPINDGIDPKSLLPPALRTEPLLGNIMNYAEVQFILAEAAARGWINSSAKDYYENGIRNSITLWGYSAPVASYFTKPDIEWIDEYNLESKLQLIHSQKYYSLLFTDLQQWFEYRRTGYPTLPKGAGMINDGQMPSRLNYPVYIQSTNRDNYMEAVSRQGADDLKTRVWWQPQGNR